jgi:hypothetical protein
MGISFGYPFLATNDEASNEAYVKLYFKSQISVSRSVLSYNQVSLMAEVGGYIGLLLGFSLLDLTKIFKQLFLSTYSNNSKCTFLCCKQSESNKVDSN